MITLKQAMYQINIGTSPEELVDENDLCAEDATKLLIQVKAFFDQVVYAAETKDRQKLWGLGLHSK
tara:strand:- start:100 stop:297 length:198 start_codon:yes stop_codon:yes gene_type:complete